MFKYIKGVSAHRTGGQLWEREYFDRIIRKEEDLRKKAEYIVMNPVRAGLVGDSAQYPWIWRKWVEGASDLEESTGEDTGAPPDSDLLDIKHR